MPGIPVHHCQIAGRHVALSFVNPVDQCSPVDIVELKIIVAMLRIRLIYIVCNQKDTAALGGDSRKTLWKFSAFRILPGKF